ncbi:MAG: hypothetical protein JWO08_3560 [Verrucomicrobiaceae bacterium]|nr:hypothetical protein [Verrucomicrobiaceae bacterium]
MRSAPSSTRRPCKRSTHAVFSDEVMHGRWWSSTQPAALPIRRHESRPARRLPEYHFRSADILDRVHWARYFVAGLSVILPLILVCRLEGARSMIQAWRYNPKISAQHSLEQGKPEEAVNRLRLAIAASPRDADLLRQLARITAKTDTAEARRCYNQIEQLGATQDEDRADHATLLAMLHDFRGAKSVLGKVSESNKSAPTILRAWITLAREARDYASAVTTLERLPSAEQADVEACLELAEAATQAPIAVEVLHRIEQHLADSLALVVKRHLTENLQTLTPRLAALPWHSNTARASVARLLHSLPNNQPEDRMAVVRLLFSSDPSGSQREDLRKAWLDEISDCGGMSAKQKDKTAAYFQQQGEHELVAELISAPEALSVNTLYLRRVESLLELGRWKEVGAMSDDPSAPILPQSRLLIQSLATLHKPGPNSSTAGRLLTSALNESRDEQRASACYATGCAALDHRLSSLASQAFATALELARDRSGLMESIINKSRHSSLGIAQLLRSLDGTSTTSDPAVQNKLIYLNLLASHDIEATTEVIRNRRAQAPDDVYLRFLDAFAANKRGEFVQAASMLIPLPRYRWHQGEAAVIASIVAATGSYDRSASLIKQIDTASLFPEEQALTVPLQQDIASVSKLVSTVREKEKE